MHVYITIIDVSIAGGVHVDAPGVIFAQGVRMNHAKTVPVVPGQTGWPNATWFGTGKEHTVSTQDSHTQYTSRATCHRRC
eukprot:COSAG02_NODE_45107_length_360_cov_0.762452_1_plen_79_part_10